MSFLWIILLLGFVLIEKIVGDVHSFGYHSESGQTLMHKELYRGNSTLPKNYTIVFRYINSYPGPLMNYAEIRVENNTSFGKLEYDDEKRTLNATITIPNAVNVLVIFTMYGFGSSIMQTLRDDSWTHDVLFQNRPSVPQSITIVNVQGGNPKPQPSIWHNSIGQRQPDDRLIHFSSQNVTIQSNFAASLFEFVGSQQQAISCVRFSFDSPTAVAFLNSSFIHENEFSAIVYDLSAVMFVANVSIFGYDEVFKPVTYQSILGIR